MIMDKIYSELTRRSTATIQIGGNNMSEFQPRLNNKRRSDEDLKESSKRIRHAEVNKDIVKKPQPTFSVPKRVKGSDEDRELDERLKNIFGYLQTSPEFLEVSQPRVQQVITTRPVEVIKQENQQYVINPRPENPTNIKPKTGHQPSIASRPEHPQSPNQRPDHSQDMNLKPEHPQPVHRSSNQYRHQERYSNVMSQSHSTQRSEPRRHNTQSEYPVRGHYSQQSGSVPERHSIHSKYPLPERLSAQLKYPAPERQSVQPNNSVTKPDNFQFNRHNPKSFGPRINPYRHQPAKAIEPKESFKAPSIPKKEPNAFERRMMSRNAIKSTIKKCNQVKVPSPTVSELKDIEDAAVMAKLDKFYRIPELVAPIDEHPMDLMTTKSEISNTWYTIENSFLMTPPKKDNLQRSSLKMKFRKITFDNGSDGHGSNLRKLMDNFTANVENVVNGIGV
ncbi:uncharacterized protein [Chironomus tepperi]|uniref:uncharacterized protein n=1 Tax=Chironomus tepperi TaxID=113505 RepID=UPI00391F85A4